MSNLVPLAEHFHSVQGEGHWVGTPMHFIRTPGCPVGSRATADFVAANFGTIPILQSGKRGSKCQTYDGRYFDCDTDFHLNLSRTVESLLEETWEHHICLTGGEPLIHQNQAWWKELFLVANERRIMIHIETSGTIQPNEKYSAWLTVAPKANFLQMVVFGANEVKLLVDEHFDIDKMPHVNDYQHVFLSPINGEKTVDHSNVERCLDILQEHPNWKLSAQWHKFLGVR